MITFNNKTVLIAGVDDTGDHAVCHYVEALGTSITVRVEDLRAVTIDELETALVNAPVIPTSEEIAELNEMDDLLGESERHQDERSERQGDLIAMFRAEY
jgi:hypothetical protein